MPTYEALMRGFEVGPWRVSPERGLIRNGDVEQRLEPLVMDVFVVLASHDGEVVSKDQLIESVWKGRPQTDDVITRCISALRRGLADDAKNPAFVETVQRRGYRIMQPVMPTAAGERGRDNAAGRTLRAMRLLPAVGLVAVLLIAWYGLSDRTPAVNLA